MKSKIEKERLFHNQRFGGDDHQRANANKYYSIDKFLNDYFFKIIKANCKNADLLEYGCGTGDNAFYWAMNGANVTGIDISDEGIKKAQLLAKGKKSDVKFYQMNAEDMQQFNENSFDIVTGRAILHHLDLNKAYSELSRVLRKNGRAVFVEPLGHNPIINLYRKLTPSMRTEDEHPLTVKDIKKANTFFRKIKVTHFHLFTILAVPFRSFFFFHSMLWILNSFDTFLLSNLPILKKYSWIVVIEFYEPIKEQI